MHRRLPKNETETTVSEPTKLKEVKFEEDVKKEVAEPAVVKELPTHVSNEDRLTLLLNMEKMSKFEVQVALCQTQMKLTQSGMSDASRELEMHRAKMKSVYDLNEIDGIDHSTGKITRKSRGQ